jgi:hypothetical protein
MGAADLEHLSPHARELVMLTPIERIAHIRGQWWIGYGRAQAALHKLEVMLERGTGRVRPPNLLIVGATNNGKSMIAEKFRRAHPARLSDDGHREIIPVLLMQMPSEPGVRRFYAMLLAALNAPVSPHGPAERLERRAISILREVETRILIIDELHNMLAGSHRRQSEFLNVLRFLGNTLRIPVVGLGTKQAHIAVRSDDQLENRFEPFPLPLWEDDLEFARLLSSFEAALPLHEPSNLAVDAELRSLILRRSGGMIGEIAALLVSAASTALLSGRERIDRAMIDAADYRGPDERRAIFEASFPSVR